MKILMINEWIYDTGNDNFPRMDNMKIHILDTENDILDTLGIPYTKNYSIDPEFFGDLWTDCYVYATNIAIEYIGNSVITEFTV